MKKAEFSTETFYWIENNESDYTCEIDDYTLRVESIYSMDQIENNWFGYVYYKDKIIQVIDDEFMNSKDRAIGFCEGLYTSHFYFTDILKQIDYHATNRR